MQNLGVRCCQYFQYQIQYVFSETDTKFEGCVYQSPKKSNSATGFRFFCIFVWTKLIYIRARLETHETTRGGFENTIHLFYLIKDIAPLPSFNTGNDPHKQNGYQVCLVTYKMLKKPKQAPESLHIVDGVKYLTGVGLPLGLCIKFRYQKKVYTFQNFPTF